MSELEKKHKRFSDFQEKKVEKFVEKKTENSAEESVEERTKKSESNINYSNSSKVSERFSQKGNGGRMFWVGFVSVLLIAGAIFAYWQFVFLPQKVRESVNKNVEIRNTFISKHNQLVTEIDQEIRQTNNWLQPQALKDNLQKISTKAQELEGANEEVEALTAQLDPGSQTETKDFSTLTAQDLRLAGENLQGLQAASGYFTCFLDKFIQVSENEKVLEEEDKKLIGNPTKAQLSEFYTLVRDRNGQIGELIGQIPACLPESAGLLPTDKTEKVQTASKWYADSVPMTGKMLEGLEKSDNVKYNEGLRESLEHNKKKPTFFDTKFLTELGQFPLNNLRSTKIQEFQTQDQAWRSEVERLRNKYSF